MSGGGAVRMLMEGGQGRAPGAEESCSAPQSESQVARRQAHTGNAIPSAGESAFLRARSRCKGGIGRGVATCSLLSRSLLSRNLRVIFFFPRTRSCRSRGHRKSKATLLSFTRKVILRRSGPGGLQRVSPSLASPLPHGLILLSEERSPRIECSLRGEGGGATCAATQIGKQHLHPVGPSGISPRTSHMCTCEEGGRTGQFWCCGREETAGGGGRSPPSSWPLAARNVPLAARNVPKSIFRMRGFHARL